MTIVIVTILAQNALLALDISNGQIGLPGRRPVATILTRGLHVSIAPKFARAIVAVGAEGASAEQKFENWLERGDARGDNDDVGLDAVFISIRIFIECLLSEGGRIEHTWST